MIRYAKKAFEELFENKAKAILNDDCSMIYAIMDGNIGIFYAEEEFGYNRHPQETPTCQLCLNTVGRITTMLPSANRVIAQTARDVYIVYY